MSAGVSVGECGGEEGDGKGIVIVNLGSVTITLRI